MENIKQQIVKVYLLSDYNEHGSENMIGTTDKSKVMQLMKDNFSFFNQQDVDELEWLLEKDKPSKDPDNLSNGWGGIQLHILELK